MFITQSPAPTKKTICLKNITVLVVEPDLAVADVLAFMLEAEGAKVQIAHELDEATALLTQVEPDVLLCNLKLPDGNGYSLLHHCPPSTRAIAIAPSPWKVERRKAISAGFHHYLFEPMEYAAVMGAIAQVSRQQDWQSQSH